MITTLVRVSERAGADLFHLEDFAAREVGADAADATAPKAAGGGL
ncbi:MAG: bacterioferritin [Mycobacterium sp.]|nr:bacterioferritin [Mycobacterium sp.]